jgi:hypothetical protein
MKAAGYLVGCIDSVAGRLTEKSMFDCWQGHFIFLISKTSEIHLASYPTVTGDFSGGKAAEA